jgi:hypothetical protein
MGLPETTRALGQASPAAIDGWRQKIFRVLQE